jgi:hypothetical protein
MTQETTEIEVEVLEIDGVAPVAAKETPPSRDDWQDWRQWGGRVRRLDVRWWPLWVVLGCIALFLALTVGLVLGLLYAVFRIILGIFRAVFG